jgi:hypothetical protein
MVKEMKDAEDKAPAATPAPAAPGPAATAPTTEEPGPSNAAAAHGGSPAKRERLNNCDSDGSSDDWDAEGWDDDEW